MKYTIAFVAMLALTAYEDERPSTQGTSGRDYRIECIGGIQCWHRTAAVPHERKLYNTEYGPWVQITNWHFL